MNLRFTRFNLAKIFCAGLSLMLAGFVLFERSQVAWADSAPPGITRIDGSPVAQPWELLAPKNVIYLGETHDQQSDHDLQLAALQALQSQSAPLAIGLEMFQRPYQSILDRYGQGDIDEAQLVQLSEYPQRWGFPWELYAPIVRWARANQIPLIALNTPTEVTRKVGKQGLDVLSFADRRFIPPISEIILGPNRYRDRLRPIYAGIHQGQGSSKTPKASSDGFERFFQAQVLWDETMADRISQFVLAHPKTRLVVLVGQGHLVYGDGIPDRVARRLQFRLPQFQQATILLNPDSDLASDPRPADYFWRSS
jgi:uncharacterized iron-regulated protein